MKLFCLGALGLASGQITCPSWEDTWPRAEVKLSVAQDGCTDGGHDGKLYSKCWVSCEEGYDMYFRKENDAGSIVIKENAKNKYNLAEIKCKQSGKWKAKRPFFCAPSCPRMYKNDPWFALRTLYSADDGFILKLRIEPEMDLEEWTAVLWFAEEPAASLSIESWETSVTTSVNQRVATFCSYESVAAGEEHKFSVTITGASKVELSNMNVRYLPGIHKDLSCIFDEDFGATTTTEEPTTTSTFRSTLGTTAEPTTTEAPCGDDQDFCIGKDPGFYAHCKCNKYYECWSERTQIYTCPSPRLWNVYFCAEPSTVDTSKCEM